MPVILDREDEAAWLDRTVTDPLEVLPCLPPLPAELMEGFPVSDLVSSIRNRGAELVRALASA